MGKCDCWEERIEYKPISYDEIKKRIAQYSKKVEEN